MTTTYAQAWQAVANCNASLHLNRPRAHCLWRSPLLRGRHMTIQALMRQFTIRFRMLSAIAVVMGLLGMLGGRACWACSASRP